MPSATRSCAASKASVAAPTRASRASCCSRLATTSSVGATGERGDRPAEGLRDDDVAGPDVPGERLEPGPQPGEGLGGRRPSSSRGVSGTVKIGAVGRPCSRSIEARWGRISSTASGGTRSRTMATAVPRSAAVRSRSHGTASAYRAAVVTNSHRSAADSSWVASSRLAETTESMSGASSRASPAGRVDEAARRTVPGWSPAGVDAGHPGQPGEDAVALEPGGVVGVVDEHRGGRRRPQHARPADLLPDDRVDQGGLAGPGRAADDGEQRRVEGPQPGQDVVVELGEQLAPSGLGAGASGDVEGQRRSHDLLPQNLDGGDHGLHVTVRTHGQSVTTTPCPA